MPSYENKKTIDVPDAFKYQYKKDYEDDWDVHSKYITNFDAYEAMVVGEVFDSVSKSVDSSKITDGYVATLARERADRVMAKLPEGETESVGKVDLGKAAFMDILRQKWIYPNANAQHPFQEKLNMWQFYSDVYGYMPMFYDWNVSPTGYVGPDCWLWNPRNLVFQAGRTSIADMDYVTALTWVSKRQLEKYLDDAEEAEDNNGWDVDALKFLIEIAENEKSDSDQDKDTQVARDRTPNAVRRGICLATRYEAGFYDEEERPNEGRWVVFAPDHACVQLRTVPNPHGNGRIPFVVKYGQPLFDSSYGLGSFQRGKPLQFARDGLTNFYFVGMKNQLVPPIVANANGVLKHTLDYRAGGVIMETIPNSVRTLEVGSTGLNTYQATMSALTGQLLSQAGSQNASLPASEALNPSQGKTPAAIDLYEGKEATRDGADRRRLEMAIEQLTDGFFSLVVNIGTEDIPVNLFAKDVEAIVKSGKTDIIDLFNNFMPDGTMTAGELTIKPEALKGVEYRFNIEPNSTVKMNKEKQLQQLERWVQDLAGFQNIFQDDPRIQVHPDKIAKVWGSLADIKGAEDFITVSDGPSPAEMKLQQENQALQQQLQQMQAQMQQHMQMMQAKESEMNQAMKTKETDMKQGMREQQLNQREQAMAAAPQPTVAGSGQLFNDPQIAEVANQLVKS